MIYHKNPAAKIRQDFIDFFKKHGHTFVPSSSLVPGGDQTLLFTNAGMVQFKDVFLGTDTRPYLRAVNSQKCMRVAGKHNDLDDVGRDDTHHTFFEMLGNWSFGDYYKEEAIEWAWELLTNIWKLPQENVWATCFRDELDEIPQDDEAADEWRKQSGMNPSHVLFFGRADNFWEMAETGPCGPCSEIHFDRGPEYCNKSDDPRHECKVNGDCQRFLELWNLVFIQYNRLGPSELEPLPARHVDTGMGLERIVSILQDVDSNYKTDLFTPLMDQVQEIAHHQIDERNANLTPYRVIADHTRAAAFLIADGVVPGNIGRNYVCRMIIRRASRFGAKIGLTEPFLSSIAEKVIEGYGDFFPELRRNKTTILDNITREEVRFKRTVESGVAKLDNVLTELHQNNQQILAGNIAFNLYTTYGLPFEIIQDIANEQGIEVEIKGFQDSMDKHRQVSGMGDIFEQQSGEDIELYQNILYGLQENNELSSEGVVYDPYEVAAIENKLLGIIHDGQIDSEAEPGDKIEVILPKTNFYVAAGGQVSDTGRIISLTDPAWEIQVTDMRKPSAGMIVHVGKVIRGNPVIGDRALLVLDKQRRQDIMRNHTATHLLHAELHAVLGDHARQAGSLVAPERLRFDFTHPTAVTPEELEKIELGVNQSILGNHPLNIQHKPLQQAIDDGAIALFGEKYGETVRNITIGEQKIYSNELCGGTHVGETGDIGLFLITSEGSAAAGIRRIEAVTGRYAYELARKRIKALNASANLLATTADEVPQRIKEMSSALDEIRKELVDLQQSQASLAFVQHLDRIPSVKGIPVLTAEVSDISMDAMRSLTDLFRKRNPTGVAVIASINRDGKPNLLAVVTEDLTSRGLHAGELVNYVARSLGGGGGGRPTLAQAGGKDASKLQEALASVPGWVETNLHN